jgi:hypothetical protein
LLALNNSSAMHTSNAHTSTAPTRTIRDLFGRGFAPALAATLSAARRAGLGATRSAATRTPCSAALRMGLFASLAAALCVGSLTGCTDRRLRITSEPSGALVTVNDVEVGRTPVDAGFTYYGVYDVRVEKPGYSALRTKARARAPIYEYPPLDLITEAIPGRVETIIGWHFTLEPLPETTLSQEALSEQTIERAHTLRDKLEAGKGE